MTRARTPIFNVRPDNFDVLAEVLLLTEFTSGAGGGNVSEAVALTSGDTDSDCEVSFPWLDGVG
ncbi:unannotated protein [freshwater metagenome]|uniref:Unannotated protein n=1 Tax=freshwater metagenome TaxID=449393 RepID=A0A6J6KIM0_9ZZZZ